jgi:L-arabinokinase
MISSTGSAPGRLDVLGGVADYSGALVLEMPTRVTTTVVAEPDEYLRIGPATLSLDEVQQLARAPFGEVRDALTDFPKWTHYVIGVVVVLLRHHVIEPAGAALTVSSDVPQSVGVSSSAALEVATARALGGGTLDPLRLATLCQEAENHVVGAPCGIMDQVTVAMGEPGAVLPILCRPASVRATLPLPPHVEVVGWPTGAEHDVSGAPYRRARTAAFMGKRIIEESSGRTWSWVSELPAEAMTDLPDTLDGASFLDRWGRTDDTVTTVDPSETYPIRAATRFGVEEHARSNQAAQHIEHGEVGALRPLLAASHAGYDDIGLGHPAATAVVDDALSRPGVHGARSSGGGSGGTVVVVCDKGALDDIDVLIR